MHKEWLQNLAEEKFSDDVDVYIGLNGCADHIKQVEANCRALRQLLNNIHRNIVEFVDNEQSVDHRNPTPGTPPPGTPPGKPPKKPKK